jgi:HEAT repeat protein
MNDRQWQDIVKALRDAGNSDRAVNAAAALQAGASEDDVPRLIELLSDADFFVREAAAWPLSDLGRVDAIPALVRAMHLGTDEGHDNDSLCAALADLVSMNSAAALPNVHALVADADRRNQEAGSWLLEFCKRGHDA